MSALRKEHLPDRVRAWNKTITLLSNDEQQIVAHGCLDLRVNGIHGRSVEGLDMHMLLDPFEEKFNLPALTIQFCDGQRAFNREVVGQEVIDLASFKILIHNEPERVWVVVSVEADSLVGKNTGSFVNKHM